MDKEKRKYARSKCLLPAEILDSEGKSIIAGRVKVKNFSSEGLSLGVSLTKLKPGSAVDLRVYLPEKKLTTSLSGEIAWCKHSRTEMELGLKISKIDEGAKEEILNWLFPKWMTQELEDKQKKKKRKKKKDKVKKKKKETKKE